MTKSLYFLIIPAIMSSTACNNPSGQTGDNAGDTAAAATPLQGLRPAAFDATIDGLKTGLYILQNENGMRAAITNYGGRLVSLQVPDKNGQPVDVVMGFDSVEGFRQSTEPYFGATIGRYGNRIARGRFTLDGIEYTLATNNGVNHLHGGKKGFQDVVWEATQEGDSLLRLRYRSAHMEEGYPGNLQVQVIYSLTGDNALRIRYEATTDQKTVVNLTNHAFFNLNGKGSILNHLLTIHADRYTPVDSTLIPTGTHQDVVNTPFDFRSPQAIGSRIEEANGQLKNGKGYDHNFVLNSAGKKGMSLAASVQGDISGIVMDVYTVEPGLQFYSGNFMESKNTLKGGVKDDFRTAFCLETQHFPDSPNQPSFPSTVLQPGETYQTESFYTFTTRK